MAESSQTISHPSEPRSPLGWLRLWFLLRDRVTRKDYAISGFGLMAVKYLVEFLVVRQTTGLNYSPLDFINPLISTRAAYMNGAPDWLGFAWVLWTLPFLWIAVSMSVRRALDAGISPWHGLWVLVPFANLFVMLLLAFLPSAEWSADRWDHELGRLRPQQPKDIAAPLRAGLGGIAVGALYATALIQFSVYMLSDYGAAVFFGTPFVTGLASGYLFNLRASHSYGATIGVALLSVVLTGAGLLLFALEGAICLVMAAPIVVPLGVLGAPIGKFLADRRRGLHRGLVGALVAVPLLATVEAQLPNRHELVVTSTIDIAAPPGTVWQQVIAFPDITERPEWFFRLGISCPTGARIDGQGVGAVRECLFTTGRFVEPITAWDAPRRLAFDVREQPEPMFELTPYRDIHPPHLDGAFRSTRGEFELVELPGGGTRLVGRTWYTLDIRPLAYWTVWTDRIIHHIHLRVLRHIRRLAEEEAK